MQIRPLRARLAAVLVAIVPLVGALALTAAGPASAAGPVPYPGSVPTWATAVNDAGNAPPDQTVEGEIYLNLRDLAGATALAAAVSTPGSPQYRRYLTPVQWIDRFSPTVAEYSKVLSLLLGAGFTIVGTPASRLFVVFRGTVAQVDATFGVRLHSYAVADRRLTAPSAAPILPADAAALVSGMALDQGRALTHPGAVPLDGGAAPAAAAAQPPPASVPAPCSAYYGEHTAPFPPAYGQTSFPTAICGYGPAQMRAAYGIGAPSPVALAAAPAAARTGAGQTVAIIDAYASPSIVADVNTYSSGHGEPGLSGGQYSQIVPPTFYDQSACGLPSGWQAEQTLDVEAVHGIAPGARILYVGAFNCIGGLDVAMSQVLDGRLATLVSNSYGLVGEVLPADVLRGLENQHLQAAAEGIGLYFASGDRGDEAALLGSPQPDYPASSPWVTSVGGTTTGIAQDGSVTVEAGWGAHVDQVVQPTPGTLGYAEPLPGRFCCGAGGGRSTVFAQPAYQEDVVPGALARGNRVSPDIAADADPFTGFRVGLRPIVNDATLATGPYQEGAFGGTSLAAPLVTAQMALVQQATGHVIGFANPAIYDIYRAAPGVFRDVAPPGSTLALAYASPRSGNSFLVTGNEDTSLTVTAGYDDVTGLGVVSFDGLRRLPSG